MTTDEIYEKLTGVFREAFGDDSIVLNASMTAGDIEGWDSFKHVELLLFIEQQFAVTLRSKEVDGLANVGDMAALLQSKLG